VYENQHIIELLMEARADPFLRNKEVRSTSSSFISFHVCRVQQEIGQED